MVLLMVTLGACLVVLVPSLIFGNWDLAAGVVVVVVAAGADLWRGLRPRQLVVAGPDGLVVRVGRTTSFLAWDDITGFDERTRRLGRLHPVAQRRDGSQVRLPAGVAVQDLRRWRQELADEGGAPA